MSQSVFNPLTNGPLIPITGVQATPIQIPPNGSQSSQANFAGPNGATVNTTVSVTLQSGCTSGLTFTAQLIGCWTGSSAPTASDLGQLASIYAANVNGPIVFAQGGTVASVHLGIPVALIGTTGNWALSILVKETNGTATLFQACMIPIQS